MLKKNLLPLWVFLPFVLGLLILSGCQITTPVAVTEVTLNQSTILLTAGGTTGALVATVLPTDATNQDLTWTSSNPEVATVADGTVTPLTAGTTTIIVATVDGGLTATCTVTVDPGGIIIGDSYGGGIVAYILQPGDPDYIAGEIHGLIAAPTDQSYGVEWGCYGTAISGANGTKLGTGKQNTINIMVGCSTADIAARICGNLILNGYDDWYLPSKDELNKLYLNRDIIGGFVDDSYWSSSEHDAAFVWGHFFSNGFQYKYHKNQDSVRIRAIRYF